MRLASHGVFVLLLGSLMFAQQPSTSSEPATVPNLINFSGTVRVSSGGEPAAKTIGMTFAIYRQQEGSAPLWLETQSVTLDANGHYSVLLGSGRSEGIPHSLFAGQEERWLGVKPEGHREQPRVLMVSVPYAFKAHEAETLGGMPASAFALAPKTSAAGDNTNAAATTTDSATQSKTSTVPGTIGHGTKGYLPMWLNTIYLGNSALFQNKGNIGIGTATPASTLDVNGVVNAATNYRIGGSTVLTATPAGNRTGGNLFVGLAAGSSNTTGFSNTFSGTFAGTQNTTGFSNTFLGISAGGSNTSGKNNTFLGSGAGGNNLNAPENTFVGSSAGVSNNGAFNTFTGYLAGSLNSTGSDNTYFGHAAGANTATGSGNTFIGSNAGINLPNGAKNIFIGENAGPMVNESNTIRVGNSDQQATYIAGISGAGTSNGSAVFVDASGKLGTTGGLITQQQLCDAVSANVGAATSLYCYRIVFITAGSFSGNLSGVAGADAKCQAEANNAGLPGTYKAWISDTAGLSPSNTFHKSTVPYRLMDANHSQVAPSFAGLRQNLLHAITITATGGQTTAFSAWTNTNVDGTPTSLIPASASCLDWHDSSFFSSGKGGLVAATNASWTGDVQAGALCDNNAALYCFQQ